MGNPKITNLIKIVMVTILSFGITTMNYAQDFKIKHMYTSIFNNFSPPTSMSSVTKVISSDDEVITAKMIGSLLLINSDEFGVFKVPLTPEMKQRTLEINQLLRIPNIEGSLITDNPKREIWYGLDLNQPDLKKEKRIIGLKRSEEITNLQKKEEKKKVVLSVKIDNFLTDLAILGNAKNKVKFADFYGVTNISPKKEGLEVILVLKNIGPFDVKFSNPSQWGELPDLEERYDEYKIWYEVRLASVYQEKSGWTRIALLPKYLNKDDFKPEELSINDFKIPSNTERTFRYLIPYSQFTTNFTNGEVDINRSKEGYIHMDQNAGALLNFWNMDVSFGGVFHNRVFKHEKTTQVKGWVNFH